MDPIKTEQRRRERLLVGMVGLLKGNEELENELAERIHAPAVTEALGTKSPRLIQLDRGQNNRPENSGELSCITCDSMSVVYKFICKLLQDKRIH